jgi:hypothetical protein
VIEKLDRRYKLPKVYKAAECEAIKQTVLVKLVRDWLDAELPEPLKRVRAREERQRDKVRAHMDSEITFGAMRKLIGVNKVALRPRQARHRGARQCMLLTQSFARF